MFGAMEMEPATAVPVAARPIKALTAWLRLKLPSVSEESKAALSCFERLAPSSDLVEEPLPLVGSSPALSCSAAATPVPAMVSATAEPPAMMLFLKRVILLCEL